MNKQKLSIITLVLIFVSLLLVFTGVNGITQAQEGDPPELSAESFLPKNPPRIILVDDPINKNIKIPSEVNIDELNATGTLFLIDYVASGNTDQWSEPCITFPESAKTSFEAAAAIWASKIHSDVPITIKACWANLGDPNTLGYSGAGSYHRFFDNSPDPWVWYQAALANSIAGEDLSPTNYDMHITYNSGYSWYYGTDANPAGTEYDLVTVAAHEIAHGLHFSGYASYDYPEVGQGTLGILGSPTIYDTFIEDGVGTRLTAYTNPSVALNTAFTSNDLWFDGPNANAANGNSRVKIYAPATWSEGSSYAHLDYATFAATEHNMMIYAIGVGSANHNPGSITLGLLKDLGWVIVSPPANDNFAAAQLLTSPMQINTWDTRGATNEDTDPLVTACGIGQGKATVWYKYTHSGADSAIAIDTKGADYDTFIAVWTGSEGSLNAVACNDNTGGTDQSAVAFQVIDGITYYIEIGYPYP